MQTAVEENQPDSATDDPAVESETPRRGVRWVLLSGAALIVLTVAASVLVEFAYLLAAEQSLNVAARAGATEATLSRSTYQSITDAVERHLANYPQANRQLRLTVLQNGRPVGPQFRAVDGDRFSIALSVPASSVVPGWLRTLSLWQCEAPVHATAERQVPDRKLRPAQS
ncbi:MAG TPA: hypothetical protein VHU84_19335 [Lacipirellulaceae bacterium]|nr:hypothetical protein [Lacipirellulaceae bacterium]